MQDVTDRTKFSSGNVAVLQVVGAIATGVAVGEARVNASYQARRARAMAPHWSTFFSPERSSSVAGLRIPASLSPTR